MADDLKWVIGIGVTLFLAFGGSLLGAFYRLGGKIESGDRDNSIRMDERTRGISESMKTADDALHERVNRVRDEYVRRTDLDGHIQRLEKNVDDVRNDIKQSRNEMNERLDKIIAGISKPPS